MITGRIRLAVFLLPLMLQACSRESTSAVTDLRDTTETEAVYADAVLAADLAAAARAVGRLAAAGPQGIDRLLALVGPETHPPARVAAAGVLAEAHYAAGIDALLAMLDDDRVLNAGDDKKTFVSWEADAALRKVFRKDFGFEMRRGQKRDQAVRLWREYWELENKTAGFK